eukprot:TRINITY_DN2699_c0_g1_i14.p1 TRINITY_DN2699_c0_g1~~TRINITY_DN2699_c0_g1_i14.p1  ORF type:complete len:116 (+),score=12.95 TRINITY_DN2699_c0_g1_i14:34-381(+)
MKNGTSALWFFSAAAGLSEGRSCGREGTSALRATSVEWKLTAVAQVASNDDADGDGDRQRHSLKLSILENLETIYNEALLLAREKLKRLRSYSNGFDEFHPHRSWCKCCCSPAPQ